MICGLVAPRESRALLLRQMEELSEKEKEILRLKDAEKFIVRQTGQYECRVCAYVYDEGEQGTAWADLSNSWRCPNVPPVPHPDTCCPSSHRFHCFLTHELSNRVPRE